MLSVDPQVARSARTQALVYLAAALVVCLLFLIRKTLLVFAIAFMFAYLVYPLVDGVDRRLSRKWHLAAVSVPFLLILSALTGIGLVLKDPVRHEVGRLTEELRNPGFRQRLADWQPLGFPLGEEIVENDARLPAMIPQLGKGLRIAERDAMNLFIIPVLSFFMLKDGRRIREWLLDRVGDRRRAESILDDAHRLMLRYMRGLLTLCLTVLVCFSAGLSALRVHYGILLALFAAPLEFVPVVGPFISAAVIIGVSAFNKYPHIPALIAFLILYRLFQDYVISPHLMRKNVELHPLLIVFGVFAGGDIGGVAGIFLSVPVMAFMRLIYYEIRKSREDSERKSAVTA